jgi:uncharacterized RDD family membrane protein YckC
VRFEHFALGPVRAAVRSSRGVLTGEAERAIDAVFAGPLPEAVGRSLVEHHVIERIAAGMGEVVVSDGADGDGKRLPQAGPGTEPPPLQAVAHSLVQSPAFKQVLTEVLSSPEIRKALAHQSAGFGAEVATSARRRSATLDGRLEDRARRLLHRHPSEESDQYGGLGTRAIGLVVDAGLAQLAFLVAGASIALVLALAGGFAPGWIDATLAGAGWFLVTAIYFVGLWAGTGQTPGMRAMGVQVLGPSGAPPSVGRALVRFVSLILAIIPLFAGFLPVLVDGRRRGLHDYISGTVVVRVRQEG